jgi:hypothetical protein
MSRGWPLSNFNVLIGYIVSITYTLITSLINILTFHWFFLHKIYWIMKQIIYFKFYSTVIQLRDELSISLKMAILFFNHEYGKYCQIF